MVATLQAVEATTPLPAESVPPWANFYSAQFPGWLPMPCNLLNMPVWDLDGGSFLVDDLKVDYSTAPEQAQNQERFPPASWELSSKDHFPTNRFTSDGRWLNPPGQTNGIASFNLLGSPTGEAGQLWGKTRLIFPGRNFEQEVWGATNQDGASDAIPVLGRVNLLVLWPRDCTGNCGLFFSAAATNSESGTVYSGRIGVNYGAGPYGSPPFIIQGRVSF